MNMIKKTLLLLVQLLLLVSLSNAQEIPENYTNPILPGYHPDPSICRVGEDYYLVNSTFEWYPGMPVYHSRDLVNWELIGYGIHRPLQLEFPAGLGDNRGVFAPTIRHHNGIFYIINTCVGCGGNYYITASNPAGPWSDPIWVKEAPGIDPSLFWDDDGRCYYVGHGNLKEKQEWFDQQGIWMQELEIETGKLIGKRLQLTHGHASNARWAEGPHLYKIEGKYLLLVAEGGTDFNHSVTVFNSDSLWGPYIPNQVNPVLTHRHLGNDYPVWATGHADLVETQHGDWWSVLLAKRKVDGFTLLARETFLCPVKMEVQNDVLTPVYNPGLGILPEEHVRPALPWSPVTPVPQNDEFRSEQLALHWNFLRTPYDRWYELTGEALEISLRPEALEKLENPSFIARRIEHHSFLAATHMQFASGKENEQAGLAIYRTSKNHYQFLKQKKELVLIKTIDGRPEEVARLPYKTSEVYLVVEVHDLELRFKYGSSMDELEQIGSVQNMNVVSDELAWGFNGSYVGMYATSKGQKSKASATFEYFEYGGLK